MLFRSKQLEIKAKDLPLSPKRLEDPDMVIKAFSEFPVLELFTKERLEELKKNIFDLVNSIKESDLDPDDDKRREIVIYEKRKKINEWHMKVVNSAINILLDEKNYFRNGIITKLGGKDSAALYEEKNIKNIVKGFVNLVMYELLKSAFNGKTPPDNHIVVLNFLQRANNFYFEKGVNEEANKDKFKIKPFKDKTEYLSYIDKELKNETQMSFKDIQNLKTLRSLLGDKNNTTNPSLIFKVYMKKKFDVGGEVEKIVTRLYYIAAAADATPSQQNTRSNSRY